MDVQQIDALWDYGHPEISELRFREQLAACEAVADADYRAILLSQLARSIGMQMRFDEAAEILDRADALAGHDDSLARVRILLERGRVRNSSGSPETARPLFEQAFDMSKRLRHDYFTVDAAHMLGIVSPGEEGIAWNKRAMAIAAASDDERAGRWRGPLYNNTAWTLHDMGEFQSALELFEKNVQWHTSIGSGDPLRIARWSVARALRSLGRIDEALEQQQQLLAAAVGTGTAHEGYVQEEIGECLVALDRDEEVRPHFAAAHVLLSKDRWLVANEAERLHRIARLGGIEP